MKTELDKLIGTCSLRQEFDSRVQAQTDILISRTAEFLIALGAIGCAGLVLYFNVRGKYESAGNVQSFKDAYFGGNSSPYVSGDAVFSEATRADIATVEAMSPEEIDSIAKGLAGDFSFTDVSPVASFEVAAPFTTTTLSAVEKFAILESRTPDDINNWLNQVQNRLNNFKKGPKFTPSPEVVAGFALLTRALTKARALFNTCMDHWMTVKQFASIEHMKPLVTGAGQTARALIDKLMLYGDSLMSSGQSPEAIESQIRTALKAASDELLMLSATKIDTVDPLLRGLESYLIKLAKELAAMAASGKSPLF